MSSSPDGIYTPIHCRAARAGVWAGVRAARDVEVYMPPGIMPHGPISISSAGGPGDP